MSALTFDTTLGKLRVHGWCVDTMHAAADLGQELAREGHPRSEWVEFGGGMVRLEARPLEPRGGLASRVRSYLDDRVPSIREYENLSWLIERHFQAVLPLAAGALLRAGRPRFEYLLTRREPDAQAWTDCLSEGAEPGPGELLAELARELGRMHALGFRHGALSTQALLVKPTGRGRRIVFRAARDGGPRPHGGSYESDLARLLDSLPLDEARTHALLEGYYAQREAQDRRARRSASARRLARARARGPARR